MIIYPAIDIKDGKVVRLLQGKFDQITEYSSDPIEMAQYWEECGAEWLHIVDLDGAKTGEPKNIETILKIANNINIPVQTGGGIRSIEAIQKLLDGGIARTILGTKVVEDKKFLEDVIHIGHEKIAVSVDCDGAHVAQRGWVEKSNVLAVDFVRDLEKIGLKTIIYTDIARDGMLSGPNIEGLKSMLNSTAMSIIVSGGISGIEDIKKLIALNNTNLLGAITGKALYEGKLDLIEALKLCSQKE